MNRQAAQVRPVSTAHEQLRAGNSTKGSRQKVGHHCEPCLLWDLEFKKSCSSCHKVDLFSMVFAETFQKAVFLTWSVVNVDIEIECT